MPLLRNFRPQPRNEALRSGQGVSGAECSATRTIGSYKSQAGCEIILVSTSLGLGSHLQHTPTAILRIPPFGRTLGLLRPRVRPGTCQDRRDNYTTKDNTRATGGKMIDHRQLGACASVDIIGLTGVKCHGVSRNRSDQVRTPIPAGKKWLSHTARRQAPTSWTHAMHGQPLSLQEPL